MPMPTAAKVTTNDNNKTKTIIEIQNGHKKVGQSNGKMANGNEESRSHGNGNGMTNGLATSSPKRCAPQINTQERLFGSKLQETSKKKVTDTYRSSIFDNSVPNSPAKTPKKAVSILERNPITGEMKIPKKITM